MKTFLFIALMFGSGLSFAGGNTGRTKSLKKDISKVIRYPKEASQQGLEGVAVVAITVNEDGTVTITDMKSSDPIFVKAIANQIKGFKLPKDDPRIGETTVLRVKYEKQ